VTAYEVTAVLTSTFVYEVRTPRSEVTAYVLSAHAHLVDAQAAEGEAAHEAREHAHGEGVGRRERRAHLLGREAGVRARARVRVRVRVRVSKP